MAPTVTHTAGDTFVVAGDLYCDEIRDWSGHSIACQIRSSSGAPVLNQIAKGSIVDLLAAGTVPTGTTGTSGRVSVSIASNTIYVENRCGAARNVAWAFLA